MDWHPVISVQQQTPDNDCHFSISNVRFAFWALFSKTGKTWVWHRVKMMTRWPGREIWPKWPIDPVTQWPSSTSGRCCEWYTVSDGRHATHIVHIWWRVSEPCSPSVWSDSAEKCRVKATDRLRPFVDTEMVSSRRHRRALFTYWRSRDRNDLRLCRSVRAAVDTEFLSPYPPHGPYPYPWRSRGRPAIRSGTLNFVSDF